jgi:HJR/Mrr/RecB family endonuclease
LPNPNQSLEPLAQFRSALDAYQKAIGGLSYPDPDVLAAPEPWHFGLPVGAVSLEQVGSLLDLGPPHGYDLIKPGQAPLPAFPTFPTRPPQHRPQSLLGKLFRPEPIGTAEKWKEQFNRADKLEREGERLRQKFTAEAERWVSLQKRCRSNEPEAIKRLMSISHGRHWLPKPLRLSSNVDVDLSGRIALCTIEIPDFNTLQTVKQRKGARSTTWVPVSASEKKRASETVLFAMCIRAAALVAHSDEGGWFDTIAANARQNWNDRATGQARSGIVGSLQATSEELLGLRLDQVDPKACFRHLKGIATPSVEDIAPVRPIFVLNTHDNRIVEGRDVAEGLEADENLAAMPWDDFEHLVRQLYEWEFGKNGAQVKVTRSSRDRGVDAIVFDPDPLRGGKFVIQAKRYTRPVDVAAVRDLYGTLLNEGANRGILVTTSSYGPDAYAFARDKPISLVDGPNLIAMLRKHGRSYKIDLAEARRLAASAGGEL